MRATDSQELNLQTRNREIGCASQRTETRYNGGKESIGRRKETRPRTPQIKTIATSSQKESTSRREGQEAGT